MRNMEVIHEDVAVFSFGNKPVSTSTPTHTTSESSLVACGGGGGGGGGEGGGGGGRY